MSLRLIDAHAHLQFPQFGDDRAQVIERTRAAGIGVINVGTDLETSRQAVILAEQNEKMWATVGIHPTDIDQEFDEVAFLTLARHKKVVAIGECGLDYFHLKGDKKRKKQIEIFERQIELAKTVNKPLMIHCRNAYSEVLSILSNFQYPISNLHFFAGDWPTARKFLDLGCTLSFTGVITFTNQYDEVIEKMPLDRLLIETDCPFVAPAPYRGKRNEPSYVIEVARRVAELQSSSFEAIAATTLANTRRLFAPLEASF
ncbi:MAG: TatD family hydrolase [Candidatus Vogelbacteria bacterium]|nr:TatD family hydrolase [Candidatus Vogelbacteria bacterium]